METHIPREAPEHWKNIYLIGYMGTGKSSTAIHLAEILNIPVIELDQVISEYYGRSIPDIFDEIGEDGFRALETLVLTTAIPGYHVDYDIFEGAVYSCGGGVPLSEVNVAAMQNTGYVVWLDASPEEVFNRISKDKKNKRPLLKGKTNISDIAEMMEIRSPYYEDASDIRIDTDGKTPEEVAGEIVIGLNLIPSYS